MLKACWDCISGSGMLRDCAANEDAYSTQLNVNGETQQAPPWPAPGPDNEIMFLFPRKLSFGDRIIVSGRMREEPRTMTASLITGDRDPDFDNVACQFIANFPTRTGSNSQNDNMVVQLIKKGNPEVITGEYQTIPATDLITDLTFKLSFTVRQNYGGDQEIILLDIHIDETFLERVTLKHDLGSIRFLALSGDVQKVENLEFQYA